MKYTILAGDDCTTSDVQEMINNHELDDIMPIAHDVVDRFMARYPSAVINKVTLVINKDATVEMKLLKEGATAADNAKVVVSDRRCAIEGCEADAEEIREVRIGSNTYCRKHFDEMFKEG